jgi:hypothetical protein
MTEPADDTAAQLHGLEAAIRCAFKVLPAEARKQMRWEPAIADIVDAEPETQHAN